MMINREYVFLIAALISAASGQAFAQGPIVEGIAVVDSRNVDITFSSAMDSSALTAAHYTLSGSGKGTLATNPDAVALNTGDTYRLTWLTGNMKDHGAIDIAAMDVSDSEGAPIGSPNSDNLPTGAIGVLPVLVTVVVVDPLHIDATFNEPMDSSALTAGHYSLSGSGKGSLTTTPDSVTAQSAETYRLAWDAGDMLNGADITITVTGTADLADNSQDGPSNVTQGGGGIGTLPTITSVNVVDESHVDVTYSEPMDNGSDVNFASNYTISGTGRGTLSATPTSVAHPSGNTYRLFWTSGEMFNGGDVTITVTGGLDEVGNPIGDPDHATDQGGAIATLPTVSAFTVDDTTRMSITFSEPVMGDVLTASSYTLTGAGKGSLTVHPDTVTLRSNETYRLLWDAGEMITGAEVTINAGSITDLAGNPMGSPDTGSELGIGIAPTSSAFVLSSFRAGTTTLSVGFLASDSQSGVDFTELYVNTPGSGAFLDTGLSMAGANGTFSYNQATTNGLYMFATRAVDGVGNSESAPSAGTASILLNTVLNGPFTQTVNTATETLLFPMTDQLLETITLTDATFAAQITVSRTEAIRESASPLFPAPADLLDERLNISTSGLDAFSSATIDWAFDTLNLPPTPVDTVWQTKSGAIDKSYYPVVTENVLTISGITVLSDLYAGSQAALPLPDQWILN